MRLAVFILVPLVVIAATVGFVFWKISGLKQRLVNDLEAELHARAQIVSLDLDVRAGELHAAGITLQNLRTDAPWDSGSVDQATVNFKFADLFAATLPVRVKVTGWKINLHTAATDRLAPVSEGGSPARNAVAPDQGPPPAPDDLRVQVTSITATQGEVAVELSDSESVAIHGVGFEASTMGGPDWTTQVQVTSIAVGSLLTGDGSVQMQSDADKVTFSDLAVRCGDGQITGGGDVTLDAPHRLHGAFSATSVPITMLVATRWQVKLAGLVSGNVTYQGDDSDAGATGKISVANGRFNLFPWLGKATVLVGLPDVGDTNVDQATADFTWKNHVFGLQNIDVRKTDAFRIAGQADVSANDAIDARLKLGLPTAAVARWPKLQTDVFSFAQDDFDWADVHVTGTPDNLQEDLSVRLLAVGASQGGQLLQQTTQKASDFINSLLK